MTINKSIGGRIVIEVASLSDDGITILEGKYSELGYKFRNKDKDFVIKYNRVKKDDLARTLEDVINEAVTMICRKMQSLETSCV